MSHTHFTSKQRIMLEGFLGVKKPIRLIASILNMARSSIYSEIKRNCLTRQEYCLLAPEERPHNKYYYDGQKAHAKMLERRDKANQSHHKLTRELTLLSLSIAKDLRRKWSPEEISGRYRRFGIQIHGKMTRFHIATQTIYNWIYEFRPDLKRYLRHKSRVKRPRRSQRHLERMTERQKTHGIDLRPMVTRYRGRIGDFEADTILGARHGKTGRIGTLVDRRTKYLIAFLIPANIPGEGLSQYFIWKVREVLEQGMRPYFIRSVTFDNGVENAHAEYLEHWIPGCRVYFAHPYRSGERGTNENTNGLLRQYFRKGYDFTKITEEQLDKVVSEINNRPRKCLHWKNPAEKMRQNDAIIPKYKCRDLN